jgi:hypothetical protein
MASAATQTGLVETELLIAPVRRFNDQAADRPVEITQRGIVDPLEDTEGDIDLAVPERRDLGLDVRREARERDAVQARPFAAGFAGAGPVVVADELDPVRCGGGDHERAKRDGIAECGEGVGLWPVLDRERPHVVLGQDRIDAHDGKPTAIRDREVDVSGPPVVQHVDPVDPVPAIWITRDAFAQHFPRVLQVAERHRLAVRPFEAGLEPDVDREAGRVRAVFFHTSGVRDWSVGQPRHPVSVGRYRQ